METQLQHLAPGVPTTLEEARAMLDETVALIPAITPSGIDCRDMQGTFDQKSLYNAKSLRSIGLAADWFRAQLVAGQAHWIKKSRSHRLSSYVFRTAIEGAYTVYVSNGAVICAAVGLGLRVTTREADPNATIILTVIPPGNGWRKETGMSELSAGTLAARFHALFAGAEDVYGTYNDIAPDETRTDGKQKGTAVTLRGRVTDDLWQRHLDGRNGIGIVPIRDDGTCMFGGIDIDVYGLNHAEIAVKLNMVAPPIIPCRSKSGGCHGYLFANGPVPAAKMQSALRAIAARMGLGDSEIFPKQSEKASDDDFGSWINMPYFDGNATQRYAIKVNGDAMSPQEFLAAAEARKVDVDWFARPLPQSAANLDLPDGPPCLQHLMELGFPPGTWNSGCLNLGIYCKKASPDGWKEQLIQLNAKNFPPDKWPSSDLNGIIKSLSKGKDYHYQCNKAPLAQYCNRDLCQTRKFGVGTSTKSFVETLADAILEKDSFARDKGDLLYLFQEGVYKPSGERFIKARVKALCIELQRSKDWSPQLAERVQEWIATDAPQLWEMPPLDTLNCRNGLLDVATRTLRPHAPEFLSPVQIAASFDPQATCTYIDEFISSVFPEDSLHLAYEVAAWLMLPDTSIQKSVLLLGEGANGKGTWLNLLLTFLGRENVAALSLHRIEADKFSAARLVGKLCNIGADLPTKELTGTSMFKALTGNDTITAERKFESSFEFRPFVRLIFSANSAPGAMTPHMGSFADGSCYPSIGLLMRRTRTRSRAWNSIRA